MGDVDPLYVTDIEPYLAGGARSPLVDASRLACMDVRKQGGVTVRPEL
jgi:hypothetical protein